MAMEKFVKILNLITDKSKNFMGMRSKRFSMIVRDNIIQNTYIEEPGEYKVSSAEHLLTVLSFHFFKLFINII